MRLRNVPGSREAIVESEFTINNPEEYKGKWKEVLEMTTLLELK